MRDVCVCLAQGETGGGIDDPVAQAAVAAADRTSKRVDDLAMVLDKYLQSQQMRHELAPEHRKELRRRQVKVSHAPPPRMDGWMDGWLWLVGWLVGWAAGCGLVVAWHGWPTPPCCWVKKLT